MKIELTNELRNRMAAIALEAYKNAGFEVMQTAGGTWYIPCLDGEGNEAWFKLSAIIPKNACEEEGTDGYSLAHEYTLKLKKKAKAEADKAAKQEACKAKKEEN